MIIKDGLAFFNDLSCLRGRNNQSLAQIQSEQTPNGFTYICCGYNRPNDRRVHQDRFCHCNVSMDGCDVHYDLDRRDVIDLISILAQAASADEILRVETDPHRTDRQMSDINWPEELKAKPQTEDR